MTTRARQVLVDCDLLWLISPPAPIPSFSDLVGKRSPRYFGRSLTFWSKVTPTMRTE